MYQAAAPAPSTSLLRRCSRTPASPKAAAGATRTCRAAEAPARRQFGRAGEAGARLSAELLLLAVAGGAPAGQSTYLDDGRGCRRRCRSHQRVRAASPPVGGMRRAVHACAVEHGRRRQREQQRLERRLAAAARMTLMLAPLPLPLPLLPLLLLLLLPRLLLRLLLRCPPAVLLALVLLAPR